MPTSSETVGQPALCHGFRLSTPTPVPELRSQAIHAVHARTGLRVLCLECDDPENLLAVCIPTMPTDDCGTPHIVEHVVLGGSREYPLRDPFVELLKSSMATFANAMTYADRTVFPVASNVPEDFRNLARVYLDAVFHPLLRPESFAQEGHVLLPGDPVVPEAGLQRQGIVLSEMRGAYDELDTLGQAAVLREVFCDTPYRFDAGGVPQSIPTLGYEQFRDYCQTHYRPERALVFCYGDLGTSAWLELLAEGIQDLPSAPAPAPLPLPPPVVPWNAPRERLLPVAIGPEEEFEDRSAVVLAWYAGTQADLDGVLALDLLDHLLLGNSGAPLRKALTDSGLGDDLFLTGYDSERYHTIFQVGLRGCTSDDRHLFEAIVTEVLEELAQDGFPADLTLASLSQMEFSRRLIDDQHPITLADTVFNLWCYGLDPLGSLALEPAMRRLRERVASDPRFLPDLIRRTLLDNPHRLLLACVPDPSLAEREREQERAELDRLNQSLTLPDRQRLHQQAVALRCWQETPDSPADVARIPQLTSDQIPSHPPHPTSHVLQVGHGVLLANDVFTGGIHDCAQAFELPGLAPDLVDLLPLFAYCLGRLDTATCDYATLAARIARLGGHLGGSYTLCQAEGRPVPVLLVQGNCLEGKLEDVLALLREVLSTTQFVPGKRLEDLLRQRRSRLLANALSDGHLIAAQQAMAGFSPAHQLRARWHGPDQLRHADGLVASLPGSLDTIANDLARIQRCVLDAGPGVLSLTGPQDTLKAAQEHLEGFGAPVPIPPSAMPTFAPQASRTALLAPAQGAYVAWCLPAVRFPHPAAPLLDVAAHLLSLGETWEAVRAQGGAYGASCEYDSLLGSLSFLSYRDPDPEHSLRVFRELSATGHDFAWTRQQIASALPAVANNDQRPLRPLRVTRMVLHHHLNGISYAARDAYRARLLEATPETVLAALSRALGEGASVASFCALGASDLLAPLPAEFNCSAIPLLG